MAPISGLMSDYTGYDSSVNIDVSRQVAARFNFNNITGTGQDAFNTAKSSSLDQLLNAQATPGHTFDDVDKMEAYLKNRFQDYQQQTTNLVALNNLKNANNALYDNMSGEYNRTVNLREKSSSAVQKMRQAHIVKKYAIGSMFFWGNMIQFSMGFLIACAILVVMVFDPKIDLNKWVAIIASSILFLFWIVIFVLMVKENSMRRKDDWNKFYFPTKNIKDALSCRSG